MWQLRWNLSFWLCSQQQVFGKLLDVEDEVEGTDAVDEEGAAAIHEEDAAAADEIGTTAMEYEGTAVAE